MFLGFFFIQEGKNALHLACEQGHAEVVKEILKCPRLNVDVMNVR